MRYKLSILQLLFLFILFTHIGNLNAQTEEAVRGLEWLRGQMLVDIDPGARLVKSYEDRTGAWTYDQALAVIAFSIGGDILSARQVLNALRETQMPDGSWQFSREYNTGEERDTRQLTGTNAWVVIAITQYELLTGDSSFRDMALACINWLVERRQEDPIHPAFGGFVFGLEHPDISFDPSTVYSTEHNVDTYSAMQLLFALTGEAIYKNYAEDIYRFVTSQLWLDGPGRFLAGFNDTDTVLDAQSWTVASLGHQGPNGEDFSRALDFAHLTFLVTDGSVNGIDNIHGFDANLEDLPIDKVWSEGSEGMVTAYRSTNDPANLDSAAFFHNETKRYQGANGGVPYTTDNNDTDWTTSNSAAGITWFLFNELEFNPFRPIRPICTIFPAAANDMLLTPITSYDGDTVYIDIRIKDILKSIDAFRFQVDFDTNHLTFIDTLIKGDLTGNFEAVSVRENSPGSGIITCGAFGGRSSIPANSRGTLISLVFVSSCNLEGPSDITISGLTDDLAGYSVCENTFSCSPRLSNGDVNNDGRLTAGDAQCAFLTYLNDQTVPVDCDDPDFPNELIAANVNCDSIVSASDASAIFQRSLERKDPKDCFGQEILSKQRESTGQYRLSLQQSISEAGAVGGYIVTVSLVVDNPEGLSAFGFSLSHPAGKLKFITVQKTTLSANWQQLAGLSKTAGKIIIGGFTTTPPNSNNSSEILQVLFSSPDKQVSLADFTISNRVDDFTDAGSMPPGGDPKLPTEFKLKQNFPNPFNPSTKITYSIPQAGHVTLKIFNLLGKEVATLVNKKQSAGSYPVEWHPQGLQSGVYFYRLQAGDFTQVRKLTLVK